VKRYPTVTIRILSFSDRDSLGVSGMYIDDFLVGWFDDLFAKDCDCYISIAQKGLADGIINAAKVHAEETGQTIIIEGERDWRHHVR